MRLNVIKSCLWKRFISTTYMLHIILFKIRILIFYENKQSGAESLNVNLNNDLYCVFYT